MSTKRERRFYEHGKYRFAEATVKRRRIM